MAENTLSYSKESQKWTSRWSYIPDWMIGMNSSFFSWKGGNLYKHHTNETRNNFYGVQYSSSLTTIFNLDASDVKLFKTIHLDGNAPWSVSVETEMNEGLIAVGDFQKLEEMYFAYIRRADDELDYTALSTQGIGDLRTVTAGGVYILTIGGTTTSQTAVGDMLYQQLTNGTVQQLGVITGTSAGTSIINIDNPATNTPIAGSFLFSAKSTAAESYPPRGYYMSVTLTNSLTTNVELAEVTTNAVKSFHS